MDFRRGGFKLQPRFNSIWLLLIVMVGALSLLYLWFTMFPGRMVPETGRYFTAGQVSSGRQYNMVLRLVFISGFLLQSAFLIWLVFGGRGAALSRWAQQVAGGNYWASLFLFFWSLWLLLRLLDLPFNLFSDYFWQHRWGFSTQTLGVWWLDYLKGAGLELVLSTAGVAILFWMMGRWPGIWWLAGAAFVSVWLVIQTFLWPVVVSPLFNRFEPVKDPAVLNMVQELSQKARLPVNKVLLMDASRRTTKSNAYFTGIGRTKRIVLYDNLLANYSLDEVKAVVAHEMGHWRLGHIIRGLALSVLGSFVLWFFLFVLLRATLPSSLRCPPCSWAVILLFLTLVAFAGNPLQNYFSRGMEKAADRYAVTLTGDVQSAVRLQVDLAAKNFSDVAPAPFIQWFSYSHPPALERINIIQQTQN